MNYSSLGTAYALRSGEYSSVSDNYDSQYAASAYLPRRAESHPQDSSGKSLPLQWRPRQRTQRAVYYFKNATARFDSFIDPQEIIDLD